MHNLHPEEPRKSINLVLHGTMPEDIDAARFPGETRTNFIRLSIQKEILHRTKQHLAAAE